MARILAIALLLSLGTACLRLPTGTAASALDYLIDRPQVIGIKLDPPLLAHGLETHVDALIVAPEGEPPSAISADICGLRRDLPVDVYNVECFREDELVEHLGDRLPFSWDPPDLSGIDCGDEPGCTSHVQLMVRADFGEVPAYGLVDVYIQSEPYREGMEIPASIAHEQRALTWDGDPTREVLLEFRIGGLPDGNFRWYADAGVLLDTGRTNVLEFDEDVAVTRNRLEIPEDFHGPLRVFVVAQSIAGVQGLGGDQAWATTVVEVP